MSTPSWRIEIHPLDIWPRLKEIIDDSAETLRPYYRRSLKPGPSFLPRPIEEIVLILFLENQQAGAVTVEFFSDHAYFYQLGVAKRFRRQGVARKLLDEALAQTKQRNLSRLELKTVESTGNVEIFTRLGLQIVEKNSSQFFESPSGSPVIEVRMQKLLKIINPS